MAFETALRERPALARILGRVRSMLSTWIGPSTGSRTPLWPCFALLLALTSCSHTDDLLHGRKPLNSTFARAAERVTDGVIAASGDGWDTELTCLIEPGGGIEWDLGQPHILTHAHLAADHDDNYAVYTSNDGHTWEKSWEASRVDGSGQQPRTTAKLAARARYVRLEPNGGDGAYSISELVLASQPQGAFPPPLEEKRGKRRRDSASRPPLWPLGFALALAAAACLIGARHSSSKGNDETPLALKRVLAQRRRLPRALRKRLPWVTAATALLLTVTALVYSAEYRYRVIDDAYISFQYAKNLATGHGPVFNIGERVEGYTNFLWIVVMTPVWWLSGADQELFTRIVFGITIGLAVVALGLVADVGRRLLKNGALPAVAAVLLLGFDDSFVTYSILGLEKHLLAVCMLLGLWLSVTKPARWEIWLGLSFALAGMTRPDGLLWMGTYFVAQLLGLLPGMDPALRPTKAALLRVGATFLAVFLTYYAWRYAYYGYPVPNTFYLKVGATLLALSRGVEYVREFVSERYGVPLLALGALALVRVFWVRWLLLHAVLHVSYIVYVGGDFYPGHRFLLVLVPTLALLTGAVLNGVLDTRNPARGPGASSNVARRGSTQPAPFWVAGAVVLAVTAVRAGTVRRGAYPKEVRTWASTVDHNVRYMQWLNGVARDGASLVLGDIGAAGFFADLRVLDVYGVVDPVVAHKKVEGFGKGKAGHEKIASAAELLARKPTYMKYGYIDSRAVTDDYYLFNAFPASLRLEALWVRDDRTRGRAIEEHAFHMNPRTLDEWRSGWTISGRAFAALPSARSSRGQNPVFGNVGPFVNSFSAEGGDAATGRLVSAEFPIVGERMRLLVGGGRDPERLRVSLLVDGQIRFSETGNNFETLGRREWDLAGLRGKLVRLEIVDDAVGNWGHILVDEIVQWTGPAQKELEL